MVSEEKEESKFIPWALKLLKNNIDLPTNARVFIESVVEGKRDPITNEAFTEDELAIIRDLIAESGKSWDMPGEKSSTVYGAPSYAGPTPGTVNYKTYAKDLPNADTTFGMRTTRKGAEGIGSLFTPEGRVGTTLGQFRYKLNKDGDVEVIDTYDFNSSGFKIHGKPSESPGELYDNAGSVGKTLMGLMSFGYIPLRAYAERQMSSESEEGRDVNVVIPKEEFAEEDYARIVEQAAPTKMPENYREGGRVKLI